MSRDAIVPQSYLCMYRTVSNRSGIEQASSNFFEFYFHSLSPNTAPYSYSLQISLYVLKSKKGGEQGCFARDELEGSLDYREGQITCIGEMGLKTWVKAWARYPSHISQRNLPNFLVGYLCKLHRSLRSRWRRLPPTTTRIGSLPVYPNSSDPGYAGRSSSSNRKWADHFGLSRSGAYESAALAACITGSCSRSRLKKSRAHRCIRRCIRVPCQNEHWLWQWWMQVVFLCPTSSCHTALNSPTEKFRSCPNRCPTDRSTLPQNQLTTKIRLCLFHLFCQTLAM